MLSSSDILLNMVRRVHSKTIEVKNVKNHIYLQILQVG